MQKENEETSIPIQGMPLPPYMYTGPFTRREGRGQRGRGEDIQNKEEILQLLEAVWEPSLVAVIRCPSQVVVIRWAPEGPRPCH